MKEFKIYRVNTLPQTGRNGDQYLLRKPNNRYEAYVVQPDGTLAFNKGITDDQNSRLERLSSSQISKVESITTGDISKLKEDYTKAEIDTKISDLGNLSTASKISLNGRTVLPVPSPVENGWVELSQGVTYTQSGGADITGIAGHRSIAEWDNDNGEWVLVDMGELPMQDLSDYIADEDIEVESFNLFNKDQIITGSYYDNATGQILVSGNFTRATNLIKIDKSKSPDGKIWINRSTSFNTIGAFYATNNISSFISGISVSGQPPIFSVDIPEGTNYIGINVASTLDDINLGKNTLMLSYTNSVYQPYSPVVTGIKGIPLLQQVDENYYYPFAPYMTLKDNINVKDSILEINLYEQDSSQQLYLKQFGRYALVGGNRRWYFEIWANDGLVYGGNNSTGRWTREEDFRGIEKINIYDQGGSVVGDATIDWGKAWATVDGGYFDTGDLSIAKLSENVFIGNEVSHPLKGLRVVFNGDSITAATNSFAIRAAKKIGMEVVDNYAIDGSTIAQQVERPTVRSPISIRYTGMDDNADVIIISAGTNDCNYSWTPFGTFSDRTVNTFYGGLHVLCEGLKKKYIGKLIVFLTPIKRNQDLPTPESTNSYSKTQKDYADAIKEVCAYWGIPVLDMFSECTLNPFIPEYITTYMPDGTHPNPSGHEIMASTLVGYLRKLK